MPKFSIEKNVAAVKGLLKNAEGNLEHDPELRERLSEEEGETRFQDEIAETETSGGTLPVEARSVEEVLSDIDTETRAALRVVRGGEISLEEKRQLLKETLRRVDAMILIKNDENLRILRVALRSDLDRLGEEPTDPTSLLGHKE